jgi:ribosomal protein S16
MDYLTDPKFAAVVGHYERACDASRRHNRLAANALNRYGTQGAQISGCVRDHFPDCIKDRLRTLATLVTEEGNAARLARPKYVRETTIHYIGRLVATRDGSGFYGVQPYRKD